MSKLPRYDELAQCPKCHCKEISTCYDHDGGRWGRTRGLIARRCGGCGYSWHEAPLDAEPEGDDE